MALPNPWYIDEQARHEPSSIRLLSYGLTTGVQGVIGQTDCAVRALGTPGKSFQVLPGGYNVLAKHSGGNYEAYAGKFNVAETSKPVSDTTSSGGRSDLVVLVIKNPYVQGAGAWDEPADPEAGPYAEIEIIEGVTSTTWDVQQVRPTWSAITLARIDRPASTGVVNQAHIRDLRSLASLGGTRTVYIENPPAEIPPIASSFYMQARPSARDSNYPSSDTVHNYWTANTQWQSWPSAATWQVPVPAWAREMDIDCQIFGAQNLHNDVFGELTVSVDGNRLAAGTIAVDYMQQPARHVLPFTGTFSVPTEIRGRVVTFRTQMRSYYNFTDNSGRRFDAKAGTTSRLLVNFQRSPDPS